jgi:hypothetical protein
MIPLLVPRVIWRSGGLDFRISIWHEIATWYGFASIARRPEKTSAFSPEDLTS